MIFKNLLRRKFRTLLTILGISIGVAAIIALGALADGMQSGYTSMMTGSKADLVLSQPNSYDLAYSAVDETYQNELLAMPEVEAVSGMLQGITATDGAPYFYTFGYPEDSFVLSRFQISEGVGLQTNTKIKRLPGKPLILGYSAAETLHKKPGDSLRVSGTTFRIVGIFQTGDAFEDSGAIIGLTDAQELLGKTKQVSMIYIQLKDPALKDRLSERIRRRWPDLSVSGTSDFANKQEMVSAMRASVGIIASMAIVLGGVGMMNAQLMAVFERTREIGVLRAVGWKRRRVLWMILGESVIVCLLGGLLGLGLGWLMVWLISSQTVVLGMSTAAIRPGLIFQAFLVVLVLGLTGGLYPAWRASRLQPIEALRYEGGTAGSRVHRLPFGGMAIQSLWQRSTRTLLTLVVIGITVGTIFYLEALIKGVAAQMNNMLGTDVEVLMRQADVADTSLSSIEQRDIDRISVQNGVQSTSSVIFTAVTTKETYLFLLMGYSPSEVMIRHLVVVDGERLNNNHQIMLGRAMATALKKKVGDTITLREVRFRLVGIYESGVGWEEMGGVVTIRDAQSLMGTPGKVTMLGIKLADPNNAQQVVDDLNQRFPEYHAAISGKFAEEMPDMKNSSAMFDGISLLTILVGGLGVMNTMLMAVLERTREIGVLRAMGWRRRRILAIILQEALLLGFFGGLAGLVIGLGLDRLISMIPNYGEMVQTAYDVPVFVRAWMVALLLGLVGGLYPAYRATRLQPIEALRYE